VTFFGGVITITHFLSSISSQSNKKLQLAKSRNFRLLKWKVIVAVQGNIR